MRRARAVSGKLVGDSPSYLQPTSCCLCPRSLLPYPSRSPARHFVVYLITELEHSPDAL